jgi:hypothetical protein
MSLRDKIKEAVGKLNPYDGSVEAAKEWQRIIRDEEEMDVLLKQPAFRSLLDSMAAEFRVRLEKVIKADPDLAAQKRIFERTLGLKGAKKQINKLVDEIIEGQED